MKIEIMIHKYHSNHIWKKMLINAPIKVDNEMRESFRASIPLAIKLPEFSFFHCFLKYLHKMIFTKMATVTTNKVTIV
jgi:hypothetical protein